MSDMFEIVAQMAAHPKEWKRVSKYAIQRGNQTISKNYVDGCTLYALWHGEDNARYFNDANEAKEAADDLLKAREAQA